MTPTARIFSATELIGRGAGDIYDHLDQLDRHWPLLGPLFVSAESENGQRSGVGASSRLEMALPPLPFKRAIVTRVDEVVRPRLIRGSAVSRKSSGLITWQMVSPGGVEDGSQTLVTLTVEAHPVGLDRLLVLAARPFLRWQCHRVLDRLRDSLEDAP